MDHTTSEEQLLVLNLPDEVLVLILGHLPLLDLAKARLVCRRLQRVIDSDNHAQLWSRASLDMVWVAPSNRAIMERAAQRGNVEALIKLAVAYLYSEGVPDGSGKGTMDSLNASKVAQYLIQAESHTHHTQPFSWLLIRPPLAPSMVCCKAVVCHRIQQHCQLAQDMVSINRLYFCVGKALTFLEDEERRRESLQWFEEGEANGCLFSAYELWKSSNQPLLHGEAVQRVRILRKIVSVGAVSSHRECLEARFELGKLYVRGYYGGVSRVLAYQYLRQLMSSSQKLFSLDVLRSQSQLTEQMLYILMDWLAEVSEMKSFPSATVHLAVSLAHRYMLARSVQCSKLQLLGISALLVASRWLGMTIITMREASWLTDSTYKYSDVVRMTGELVSVLRGEIRSATIADYLEILLLLVSLDYRTSCMAYYLSESALLYSDFGQFTVAHISACCLLLARILLDHDYPWPALLTEATGFTLGDLRHCTAMLYDKCLTDKYPVTDHRGVRLNGVITRYAEDRFMSVSQMTVISYQELLDKLGLFLSPSPPLVLSPQSKLFSFISDSQYQSSADDSLVNTSFLDKFGTQRLTDSTLTHHTTAADSPAGSSITAKTPPLQPNSAAASSPIYKDQRCSSLPPLPSVSPVLNHLYVLSDSDSETDRPSSSMSLPPLAPEKLTSADRSLDPQPCQSQRLDRDTYMCSRSRNRPSKPLQSIGNQQLRPSSVPIEKNVTEKRSPRGAALPQSSRTKRRRHAMNRQQH